MGGQFVSLVKDMGVNETSADQKNENPPDVDTLSPKGHLLEFCFGVAAAMVFWSIGWGHDGLLSDSAILGLNFLCLGPRRALVFFLKFLFPPTFSFASPNVPTITYAQADKKKEEKDYANNVCFGERGIGRRFPGLRVSQARHEEREDSGKKLGHGAAPRW